MRGVSVLDIIRQKFFYLFGYSWKNNIIFRASEDMIKGFLNVKASGAFVIGVMTGVSHVEFFPCW
jgi:hypothetical protein